jgi:hypothetical protein
MDELRKKLNQVEDDLRGLREDKAAKARAREEKKEAYAARLAAGEDTAEVHAEAMEAVRQHGEVADQIEQAQSVQADLLKMLGDREGATPPARGGDRTPQLSDFGWASASLFEDPAVQERLLAISGSQSRFGSLDLGEVASRDALVAELSAQSVYGSDVIPPNQYAPSGDPRQGTVRQGRIPILPRPVRDQLSFLNLIPVGSCDGNTVPYTQETPVTGTDASPARETEEGELKPEGTWITYTDDEAPVRTIAVWLKTRKQVLSDVPALRSTMDTRLRYMVQKRLAEQVLNGDGNGVNIRGILQTSGLGEVAYNGSVPMSEQILSGITNIYLNDGAADGALVNPIDWQTIVTAKYEIGGSFGSAEYVGGGPFGSTPSTVWGVRCIPTQVMTQGSGLVADFGLGAQLLIREGVQVLFSDSDQDDFLRNRVTMLAEMRAALLVWRPALFQQIAFAA